jgi:hypothetical protein
LIALLIDTLRAFGLTAEDFVIRLSSRNAWQEFYEAEGEAPAKIGRIRIFPESLTNWSARRRRKEKKTGRAGFFPRGRESSSSNPASRPPSCRAFCKISPRAACAIS